jgi:hypothetical protein
VRKDPPRLESSAVVSSIVTDRQKARQANSWYAPPGGARRIGEEATASSLGRRGDHQFADIVARRHLEPWPRPHDHHAPAKKCQEHVLIPFFLPVPDGGAVSGSRSRAALPSGSLLGAAGQEVPGRDKNGTSLSPRPVATLPPAPTQGQGNEGVAETPHYGQAPALVAGVPPPHKPDG